MSRIYTYDLVADPGFSNALLLSIKLIRIKKIKGILCHI
jgi:hypothetical protein